ncbi:MAG: hypothetical protein QXG12_04800 [Thermoproteota archaeon]
MSRKGISAVAATVFGIIALLIGLTVFSTLTLALIRGVGSGGEIAEYRALESKSIVKVVVELVQEKSGDQLLNKTYIVFENIWPDEVTIDHVAIVSKSGQKILDKAMNIQLKAGRSVRVKPSQIDQSLQLYDEDFWKLKREVDYVEMHVDIGGKGSSFKSYPVYSIYGGESPEIIITTTTVYPTTTTMKTVTTTITKTTTPTTTKTITTTSTMTSTYTTTPTVTTTKTCTYTTCKQQLYATGYTAIRTSIPTYITITMTSYSTSGYCSIIRHYSTIWVTSTYVTIRGSRLGTITCGICGTCPTTIYQSSSLPTSNTLYYIGIPLLLVGGVMPGRLSRKELIIAFLILGFFMSVFFGDALSEGITVTVTETGTTTTSTVTTTSTTTYTSTAPTTTVTSTVTTTFTTTLTSTAPTITSTITSTTLTSENWCLGVKSTVTVTERPIIVITSTKLSSTYCNPNCSSGQCFPRYITVTDTVIVTHSVVTYVYDVQTYVLRCQTTR